MTAQPNYNRGVPLLICDPEREWKSWETPKNELTDLVRRILQLKDQPRWQRFEFARHDKPETINENITRGKREYGAVILPNRAVVGNGKRLASIRRRDPLIPIIVVNDGTPLENAVWMIEKLNGRYASNEYELDHLLTEAFFLHRRNIKNGYVVKLGGSAHDYDRITHDDLALYFWCDFIGRTFKEQKPKKGEQKRKFLCTVGAGQHGDIVKEFFRKYGHINSVKERYAQFIAEAFEANLAKCESLFPEQIAIKVKHDQFYLVGEEWCKQKISLMATVPPYIMVRDDIPLEDSDTHTIALAEFYGIDTVLVVKRTDGIYAFDPYRGLDQTKARTPANERRWQEAQRSNKRYREIDVEEILKGENIVTRGSEIDGKEDGTTGHLMEASALEYFAQCHHVRQILVVHIAPGEMYRRLRSGYRHIITGETLPLSTDWNAVRERQAYDALFNGLAVSKIIRKAA